MHKRQIAALFAGCSILLATVPSIADETVQSTVMDAFRSGKTQQAFDLAMRAAGNGDPWAMDMVGLMYLSGPAPLRRDYNLAFDWLNKAASTGNGDAMSRLGEIYFNGWGVARNVSEAVAWYRRGIAQGSHAAMNNLALCLLNGDGVDRNVDEGLALLRNAADKDPIAQENLAKIDRSGEYGEKDLPQALRLFEASAAQGSSSAMVALAQMNFNGEGTPKDVSQSCKWAIIAYTKGRKEAAAHVSNVCRTQLDKAVFAQRLDEATQWIDQHPDAFGPLARP